MRAMVNRIKKNLNYNNKDYSLKINYTLDKDIIFRFFDRFLQQYFVIYLSVPLSYKIMLPYDKSETKHLLSIFPLDTSLIFNGFKEIHQDMSFIHAFLATNENSTLYFINNSEEYISNFYSSSYFIGNRPNENDMIVNCEFQLRLTEDFTYVEPVYILSIQFSGKLYYGNYHSVMKEMLNDFAAIPLGKSLNDVYLTDRVLLNMLRI